MYTMPMDTHYLNITSQSKPGCTPLPPVATVLLSTGLVSTGLVSTSLVSTGLVSTGLVSTGLVSVLLGSDVSSV